MRIQVISAMKGTRVDKICGCGKIHVYIPMKARDWFDDSSKYFLLGYVWECECKSSLFASAVKLTTKRVA